MNARQLSEEIKETQEILARLLESLEAAQNQPDPFGVFVYRERRAFRDQANRDHSKSGKRTKEWVEQSYFRATAEGFRGDFIAWLAVLRAQKPKVEPDGRT
jgi:hypothetical protein